MWVRRRLQKVSQLDSASEKSTIAESERGGVVHLNFAIVAAYILQDTQMDTLSEDECDIYSCAVSSDPATDATEPAMRSPKQGILNVTLPVLKPTLSEPKGTISTLIHAPYEAPCRRRASFKYRGFWASPV
jgi:hypothetical protein